MAAVLARVAGRAQSAERCGCCSCRQGIGRGLADYRSRARAPSPAFRTAWSASPRSPASATSTTPRPPTLRAPLPRSPLTAPSTGSSAGAPRATTSTRAAPGFPHVARAYTIGEAGPRFAAVLAPEVPVTECGTLDAAVHAAAEAAQPGETVLLSPACRQLRPVSRLRGAGRRVPGARSEPSRMTDTRGTINPNLLARVKQPRRARGPFAARHLVLGHRPGAAVAHPDPDRHRPDRGRRRVARQRGALFGRASAYHAALLFLAAADVGGRQPADPVRRVDAADRRRAPVRAARRGRVRRDAGGDAVRRRAGERRAPLAGRRRRAVPAVGVPETLLHRHDRVAAVAEGARGRRCRWCRSPPR